MRSKSLRKCNLLLFLTVILLVLPVFQGCTVIGFGVGLARRDTEPAEYDVELSEDNPGIFEGDLVQIDVSGYGLVTGRVAGIIAGERMKIIPLSSEFPHDPVSEEIIEIPFSSIRELKLIEYDHLKSAIKYAAYGFIVDFILYSTYRSYIIHDDAAGWDK